MVDKVYEIDYKRLSRWLTPLRKRTPAHVTWLYALMQPLVSAYVSFLLFRSSRLYRLSITPETGLLEKMLNDRFDNTERRIYIDDTVWYEPWYAYQEDELKPVFAYQEEELLPIATYTESEAGEFEDDFIVHVPALLVYNVAEMRALINIYKLPGTHYKIENI